MKKSNIKWIREFDFYGTPMIHIMYESGRLYEVEKYEMPATAKKWLQNPNLIETEQYDRTLKRHEIIYEV